MAKNSQQIEHFFVQLKSITDHARYMLCDINAIVLRGETTRNQVAELKNFTDKLITSFSGPGLNEKWGSIAAFLPAAINFLPFPIPLLWFFGGNIKMLAIFCLLYTVLLLEIKDSTKNPVV